MENDSMRAPGIVVLIDNIAFCKAEVLSLDQI